MCLARLSQEPGTMNLNWQVYGPKDVEQRLSATNQYKYMNATNKYKLSISSLGLPRLGWSPLALQPAFENPETRHL